jgi:hypothetical protein
VPGPAHRVSAIWPSIPPLIEGLLGVRNFKIIQIPVIAAL